MSTQVTTNDKIKNLSQKIKLFSTRVYYNRKKIDIYAAVRLCYRNITGVSSTFLGDFFFQFAHVCFVVYKSTRKHKERKNILWMSDYRKICVCVSI